MICEKCKAREATIVFAEMNNGVRKEHYFCSKCAAESDLLQSIETEFSLSQLLSGILGMASAGEETRDAFSDVVCPTCHRSYATFVADSRFGCEDCYQVFGPLIAPNIRKLQGNDVHIGKRPKFFQPVQTNEKQQTETVSAAERIRILQNKLQEALALEDYEQAVVYRDAIRKIKEENHIDE